MIVLDTNVLSELMRPRADERVVSWLGSQAPAALWLTAIAEAELWLGLELLPRGRRRDALTLAAEGLFKDFDGRVLPFDSAASREFASLVARRRGSGRPIAQADAQVAAIARSRGAQLATRNLRDFEGLDLSLVDPWSARE